MEITRARRAQKASYNTWNIFSKMIGLRGKRVYCMFFRLILNIIINSLGTYNTVKTP